MRIKVFHVNGDIDYHNTKFLSYDSTLRAAGRVDPSIYRTVLMEMWIAIILKKSSSC